MKTFLIILIAILLLAMPFVFKTLSLLRAKPTITVDYTAEYNKLTKPSNYDPNENAAFYYSKAFDTISDMPELVYKNDHKWPADMNEPTLEAVGSWLQENQKVFKYVDHASQKPYCWFERHAPDDGIFCTEMPELSKARGTAKYLGLQAKLNAMQGQDELAFLRVLQIHQLGLHYSGPVTLVEQLIGLASKSVSFKIAFAILDNKEIDSGLLKEFQEQLIEQIKQSKPFDFSAGEKMYFLDGLQKMFTDNGKGGGKLIPEKLFEHKQISNLSPAISRTESFLICLTHPGRKETIKLHNRLCEELDSIQLKTPWQIQNEETSYSNYAEELTKDNYLLNDSAYSLGRICEILYREETESRAILTILASLRYKAEKGVFPDSLEELVSAGYLQELPSDPYSDRSLVYKKTGNDFILYSIGADFIDNGGIVSNLGQGEDGGDQVFWPVQKPVCN